MSPFIEQIIKIADNYDTGVVDVDINAVTGECRFTIEDIYVVGNILYDIGQILETELASDASFDLSIHYSQKLTTIIFNYLQ